MASQAALGKAEPYGVSSTVSMTSDNSDARVSLLTNRSSRLSQGEELRGFLLPFGRGSGSNVARIASCDQTTVSTKGNPSSQSTTIFTRNSHLKPLQAGSVLILRLALLPKNYPCLHFRAE